MGCFVGFDLSLTQTGFGVLSGQGLIIRTGVIKPGGLRGVMRLEFIRQRLAEVMRETSEPILGIAIEGYSMGSQNRAFDIGELGGVARMEVRAHGCSGVIVPPKSLKKMITGNGNADKPMMISAVNGMFDLQITNDNEADACGLAELARRYFGTGMTFEGVSVKDVKSFKEMDMIPAVRGVPTRQRPK